MVKGIETAANGMMGILTWNDVIANNLANVNTSGFKSSMLAFKNVQDLAETQKSPYTNESTYVGTVSAGGVVDSTILDMKQGAIKVTGNPLDLAISGKGFFTVQTPEGVAYTRNGNFIKNSNGLITTLEGYPLLGEKGPISIDLPDKTVKDINITSDGNVYVGKNQIDKINMVEFNKPEALQVLDNSLYKAVNGDNPKQATNFQITQGALEQSNANVVTCMIDSINGSRTYETLAKIVESTNKTLSKSVNEVGRIKK